MILYLGEYEHCEMDECYHYFTEFLRSTTKEVIEDIGDNIANWSIMKLELNKPIEYLYICEVCKTTTPTIKNNIFYDTEIVEEVKSWSYGKKYQKVCDEHYIPELEEFGIAVWVRLHHLNRDRNALLKVLQRDHSHLGDTKLLRIIDKYNRRE